MLETATVSVALAVTMVIGAAFGYYVRGPLEEARRGRPLRARAVADRDAARRR